ncbi:MAG: hypothetical protein IJ561_00710 [Ruminococcus sp.]|nr:hypothetical protein [Ruminococcus sp.]
MNEQGIAVLSLFSELDERYIAEAQEEKLTLRHRRIFKAPFIAAAAAAILALSSVGAVAYVKGWIGHKENVEHQYFYNKALIPELEKRAGEPLEFENEHLRITVDAIISDAVYVEASATIEGLDKQGKKFVEDGITLKNELDGLTTDEVFGVLGRRNSFVPFMTAPGRDGEIKMANSGSDGMFGKKGESSESAFTIGIKRDLFPDCETLELTCIEPIHAGIDDWTPGIFEGIVLEIPMKRNFDTLVLDDKSGREVYLSEVCFYQSKSDIWGGKAFDLTVYSKDGSEQNIRDHIVVGEYLFDLENVDHIVFNGRTFYPKELISADREETE